MPWTSLLVGPSQPKEFKTSQQIGEFNLEVLHSNKKSLDDRAQFSDILALDDRSDDVACYCSSAEQDLEKPKVALLENSNNRSDIFENFITEILEFSLTKVIKSKLKLDFKAGDLEPSSLNRLNGDLDSKINALVEKFLNESRDNQDVILFIDVIRNKSETSLQLYGKIELGSLLVGLEVDYTEVEEVVRFSSGLLKYSLDDKADIIHLNIELNIAEEIPDFRHNNEFLSQIEKVVSSKSDLNFNQIPFGILNGSASYELKSENRRYLFDQLSMVLESNKTTENEDGKKYEQLRYRLIDIASGLKDSSGFIFDGRIIFNNTHPSWGKGELISISSLFTNTDRYYIENPIKEDANFYEFYKKSISDEIRPNIFNLGQHQMSRVVEIQKSNKNKYPTVIQSEFFNKPISAKTSSYFNDNANSISSAEFENGSNIETPIVVGNLGIYSSDIPFSSLNEGLLSGEMEISSTKEIDRIRTENLLGLRRDIVYWISAQFRGLVENSDSINFPEGNNHEIIVKNQDLGSIRVLLVPDQNLLKIHFICTEYGTDIVLRSNIESLIDEMHRSGYRDVRTSFSSEGDASGLQHDKEKNDSNKDYKRKSVDSEDSKDPDSHPLHLISIYDGLDLRL